MDKCTLEKGVKLTNDIRALDTVLSYALAHPGCDFLPDCGVDFSEIAARYRRDAMDLIIVKKKELEEEFKAL